jgi:hypothetical protein
MRQKKDKGPCNLVHPLQILSRQQCDEGRPQCENCLKYGTICPGYDRGLKFVTGKPYRTKRSRVGNSVTSKFASPSSLGSRTTSPFPGSTSSPPISLDRLPQVYTDSMPKEFNVDSGNIHAPASKNSLVLSRSRPLSDLAVTIPATIQSHRQYQLQLVTSLCDSLPKTTNPQEIQMMTTYLRHLPERFGNSKALDAAVVAFTTQQIGTTFDDFQMLRSGRDAYVQALSLLQSSLNDSWEALRSETLATASLLCTYEVCTFLI